MFVLAACSDPGALTVDVQAPGLDHVDIRLVHDTGGGDSVVGPKRMQVDGEVWNEAPFDVLTVQVDDTGVARVEIDDSAGLNNGEEKSFRFVAIGFTGPDDSTATTVGFMNDVPLGTGEYRQLELATPGYLEVWRTDDHACAMVESDGGNDIYTLKDDLDCDALDAGECAPNVYLAQGTSDVLHDGATCSGDTTSVVPPTAPLAIDICSLGGIGCDEVSGTSGGCVTDSAVCATGELCLTSSPDELATGAELDLDTGGPPTLDCPIFQDPIADDAGAPCPMTVAFAVACDHPGIQFLFQDLTNSGGPQKFEDTLDVSPNVRLAISVVAVDPNNCQISVDFGSSKVEAEDIDSSVTALLAIKGPNAPALAIPARFTVLDNGGMTCDLQPTCNIDLQALIDTDRACHQ